MTKIHVSVVKVNREYLEQHFDELVERLYPERKSRVLAFRRREPAYTSIVAGLLLQTLVEEKLGISPQALVLEKNENGKPTVQGHPAFYFNLSHAGDYVVLAHGDVPLGVDIEQIRERIICVLPDVALPSGSMLMYPDKKRWYLRRRQVRLVRWRRNWGSSRMTVCVQSNSSIYGR